MHHLLEHINQDIKGNKAKIRIQKYIKIVSEYDQVIPQSQTADKNPSHREEEPHNNYETPGRQTKQSNQLSLLNQDDCITRRDIK